VRIKTVSFQVEILLIISFVVQCNVLDLADDQNVRGSVLALNICFPSLRLCFRKSEVFPNFIRWVKVLHAKHVIELLTIIICLVPLVFLEMSGKVIRYHLHFLCYALKV